jgi:hypothetical protein
MPPSTPFGTVFMILLENTDWSLLSSSNSPFVYNHLLANFSYALNYKNPPALHPSEPNYIWLEAGSNLGLTTDNDASASNSVNTSDHLVSYLTRNGLTWKAYQENIPGNKCPLASAYPYAAKHNPFIFFQDVTNNNNPNSATCIAHIRPFTEFFPDLLSSSSAGMAAYNFITPNLCNDGHDCSIDLEITHLSCREEPHYHYLRRGLHLPAWRPHQRRPHWLHYYFPL